MDPADTLNALTNEVKTHFIGRDETLDLLKLSVIAQTHLLLIGPPGTGKSALFGDFFSRLEGKRGYWLLNKGSLPESLVGPMSMKAYKEEDQFRHNVERMLPDVHWAFIDEVFKGNALTRDAALQVINERVFANGGEIISCPLRTCGAASNEYDNAEDSAFRDRFLATVELEYLSDHAQRMQMVHLARTRDRGLATSDPVVSLRDLDELYERAQSVTIPDSVEETAANLYQALASITGANIGDRRWAQSFGLASALAVSNHRDVLVPEDLTVFAHTCWKFSETRPEIQRTVLRVISPEIADATDIFDSVEEGFMALVQTLSSMTDDVGRMGQARQFVAMASDAKDALAKLVIELEDKQRDASRARDYYARVNARVREAIDLPMGGKPDSGL